MTREEKEHIGKYILEVAKSLEDGCYQQEIFLGAVHIIDESLEQESCVDRNDDEEPGNIDRTAVTLTNLTVIVRLLTIEEILGLIRIITKELYKRHEIKAESEDKG